MKVLLLPDRFNWAYHSIAKSIVKFNTDDRLLFDIEAIKKNVPKIKKIYKKYDLFFVMGQQSYESVDFLPKNRTLTGVHSHHQFDDKKTMPDKDVDPPKQLIDTLSTFLRVNVVSRRLYELFKRNGLLNVWLTENGVDSTVFKPGLSGKRQQVVVGYSGSKKHDWRKGVTEFILPAANKAGAKTEIAMLSTGNYVPLEEMPSFYDKIDIYVCASSSEGFSLSVLEAASCGKPIISTRVGGCVDLIKDGVNGFLVNRDVKEIVRKIEALKDPNLYKSMSHNIRQDIVNKYDWSIKVHKWIDFVKNNA